jgi:uncharacterized protein
MASLKVVESAITAAMKAGDKGRTAALRLLVSTAKGIAKNDGNRDVTDADMLVAGNRMIKQARETRSFLEAGDERIAPIDAEIAIVEEFLPRKMSRTDLAATIDAILQQDAAPEGKAARGYVMKTLNADYPGEFEARDANDILTERLA